MAKKNKKPFLLKKILSFLPEIFILAGFSILILTFGCPFFYEVKFRLNQFFLPRYKVVQPNESVEKNEGEEKVKVIVPESFDFGIVIPKIDANARIFPNIDPFNENEFLPVLRKGVAHAKGSSFPGQGKNIYLFAHSTDAFFNVGRYNAVFYLIGKLQKGDEVDIFYKDKLFRYFVFEKKVVFSEAIQYLKETDEEILTLQTCYPPGTTLGRLVVRARPER